MAYEDRFGTLFSDDKKRLVRYTSELSDYTIPEGTEIIAANAFKDNLNLKVIHLPSTIKLVEYGAFSNCKIDDIHFAGDIEQWLQITWNDVLGKGYRLFFNKTDLVESIIIPDSISIIKHYAFYYCTSLQSVIFNKNIITIEDSAFNKSGLRGILTIPKSCKKIKYYAFFYCTGITKVKIPEATEEIWYGAFSACYGLQSFFVSPENNHLFTDAIGLYLYSKELLTNIINKNKLRLIALASGDKKKYSLHENTASISSQVCCFNSIPGGELEIPHTVSLSDEAFRECRGVVTAPINMRKAILDQGLPNNKFKAIFVYQDALISQKTPEVILLNPFRVLGVYCNASQREIQSNATKIKRYLEIGKQPSFKTDFNEVFPPIERTQEMVDKALSQISQPRDKLAHALFWFAKPCCEQHKKAEELLHTGNCDKACELLCKNCGNYRVILTPYFYLAKPNELFDYASIFYKFSLVREESQEEQKTNATEPSLKDEICDSNFNITEEECQVLFFDKLMTFVNPIHLWVCASSSYLSKNITEYLFSKSIGKNIAHINSQVATITAIDIKDTEKLLNAIQDLKQKTTTDIEIIDEFMSPSDVRYTSIHDTLSNQILQSAIDCYNHSEPPSNVAREVYALMSYANSIAKGELLKSRCEENMKIVKNVVDELPPIGLEIVDKELYAAVTRARNSADTIKQAFALLKEAEPYLIKLNSKMLTETGTDIVQQIKVYFTKVSTVIANVCLNKLIEEVNSSHENKNYEAWMVITALNQLPLDAEFKNNRYDENVTILINNIAKGIFGVRHNKNEISYGIIDIRPEQTVWLDCVSKKNYEQYIKRFPHGVHIKEAIERQSEIDRLNEERRRRQKEQREQERKRREEERIKAEKIKRKGLLLNWLIFILVVFIVFEVIYAFWGWNGVFSTLGIIVLFFFLGLLGAIFE